MQQFLAFAANAAHGAQFALGFSHRITAAPPAAERAFAPVVGQWWRVAAFEVLLQPGESGLHLAVQAAVQAQPFTLSAGIEQPALAGRGALHRLQQPAPEGQGEAMLPGAVAPRLQQRGLVAEVAQLAGLRLAQQQGGPAADPLAPQQQQPHRWFAPLQGPQTSAALERLVDALLQPPLTISQLQGAMRIPEPLG